MVGPPTEQAAVAELLRWTLQITPDDPVSSSSSSGILRSTQYFSRPDDRDADELDLEWRPELALNDTDFCFGEERLLFLPLQQKKSSSPVVADFVVNSDTEVIESLVVEALQVRTSKRTDGGVTSGYVSAKLRRNAATAAAEDAPSAELAEPVCYDELIVHRQVRGAPCPAPPGHPPWLALLFASPNPPPPLPVARPRSLALARWGRGARATARRKRTMSTAFTTPSTCATGSSLRARPTCDASSGAPPPRSS